MTERDVDIDSLFEPGNEGALETYLRLLHPADIAELFNLVREDLWVRVVDLLPAAKLAQVLAELDEGQLTHLGAGIEVDRLVEAIDHLETDDAADVLAVLARRQREEVLKALEDRAQITVLLAYPEDSAGGIMQKELCRVLEGSRVRDAIEAVRRAREAVEDVLEVYVVDRLGRLKGTVSLEDLVLSNEETPIGRITLPVEEKVTPEMDQEEVAQLFGKYDLVTLPVVNHEGALLGRITFDDVYDVVEEEHTEDIMAMAGASPEDFVYGSDFLRIALLRLPWLFSSMVGSMLTAFLVAQFARIPGDAIVMAAFVPVVMAMTGNVGSQSAMITIRGFATGRVESSNLSRALMREVFVGLTIGVLAGTSVGLVAHLWKSHALLGLAVACSMICSVSVASAVGVAAPAIFRRIGIDPAIAAGPLVTTGSDIIGVLIYLGIAIVLLG